jgi:cytoskeletal protein CcmA (bactofilin family)
MVNLNYLDGRQNKRMNRLERGTPLGSSAVSRGRTRFIGEESIVIEGSGRVSGTLIVDGKIDGEGKMSWTGPADFDGDVKITKTLDVSAETRLRGETTLEANMNVTNGGKVVVGSVELGITSNGRPGLDFDGATLTEASDRLAMGSGTATVGVAPTFAAVAVGNKSVVVTNTDTTLSGPVKLASLAAAPSGTAVYTVVADASGKLHRSSVIGGA